MCGDRRLLADDPGQRTGCGWPYDIRPRRDRPHRRYGRRRQRIQCGPEFVLVGIHRPRPRADHTSEPLIAQLGDGTWVAIFGSGRDAGKASLFVVDLAGGTLIEKIEITSAGAGSGLSSPVGWDQDFDGEGRCRLRGRPRRQCVEVRFYPMRRPSAVRIVAFSGNPLVKVTGLPGLSDILPITTRPLVSINPDGGVLVYFGTGMNGQGAGASNGMFGVVDKGVSLGSDPGSGGPLRRSRPV